MDRTIEQIEAMTNLENLVSNNIASQMESKGISSKVISYMTGIPVCRIEGIISSLEVASINLKEISLISLAMNIDPIDLFKI